MASGVAFVWRLGGTTGRKRAGGSGLVPHGGKRRSGEGGARVRCCLSRHGTGAVAPGRSDSGRRCTSHGRGGRAVNRGGGGASDAGATADRWGVMTRGPGGGGWVRE
jgi:hypothetical protein